MVLGPPQTQSNVISDEKTSVDSLLQLVINFGQFDWFKLVSDHLLDLLETTPDPSGYYGKGPSGVGSTLDPIQCQF